jgi:hypothetical protein
LGIGIVSLLTLFGIILAGLVLSILPDIPDMHPCLKWLMGIAIGVNAVWFVVCSYKTVRDLL